MVDLNDKFWPLGINCLYFASIHSQNVVFYENQTPNSFTTYLFVLHFTAVTD